jgi:hypothetical protein
MKYQKIYTNNEINKRENCIIYNMDIGPLNSYAVVLMDNSKNKPYNDECINDDMIIYEGHDNGKVPKDDRKTSDQTLFHGNKPNQNSYFVSFAEKFMNGEISIPKPVRVYKKLNYNCYEDIGFYGLIKVEYKSDTKRKSFKFSFSKNYKFTLRDRNQSYVNDNFKNNFYSHNNF